MQLRDSMAVGMHLFDITKQMVSRQPAPLTGNHARCHSAAASILTPAAGEMQKFASYSYLLKLPFSRPVSGRLMEQ